MLKQTCKLIKDQQRIVFSLVILHSTTLIDSYSLQLSFTSTGCNKYEYNVEIKHNIGNMFDSYAHLFQFINLEKYFEYL